MRVVTRCSRRRLKSSIWERSSASLLMTAVTRRCTYLTAMWWHGPAEPVLRKVSYRMPVRRSVHFDARYKAVRRITADASEFVRRLNPDRSPDELPPLPVTHDLALWLAADMIRCRKRSAPVSTWPDILIGDNHFPDDAWQFDERLCPIWVRDAEGLPAVRFDGWSTYMATSPMATGDRQTAFVVCLQPGQLRQRKPRWHAVEIWAGGSIVGVRSVAEPIAAGEGLGEQR